MGAFAAFLHFLRAGRNARLFGYESLCLEKWRESLPADAAQLLDAQLRLLTWRQRQVEDRILMFTTMDARTRQAWPEDLLFPCRLDEAAVARLTLAPAKSSGDRTVTAHIVLARGRFFGLEFSETPELLHRDARIVRFQNLLDPMEPVAQEPQAIDRALAEKLIASFDTVLPAEYLSYVGGAGPLRVNEWEINDLAHIRKVPDFDANFYLLAEKEGGLRMVGVTEGDRSGIMYYLEHDAPENLPIKTSFIDFLRET